jgi:hypothetical protein
MVENIKKLVRPFISISITIVIVYLAIKGQIDSKEIITFAGIIIGFHFGERANKNNG